MRVNAIQHIGEKEDISDFSVVKRFDSKMIASAKKGFPASVPDRERKIPAKMPNTFFAPNSVCVRNQFGISGGRPAI
jgi:hypothetical protein